MKLIRTAGYQNLFNQILRWPRNNEPVDLGKVEVEREFRIVPI